MKKINYESEFNIQKSQIILINYLFEEGKIIQAYKLSKLLEKRYHDD